MMKQMESISLAFQEQTKTNSILAGTLNMLVKIFARIEERISSVQTENTNLQGQMEAMAKRLRALETKPATSVQNPRTIYSAALKSGLPPHPATNTKPLNIVWKE
jgi:septal ring factor EnvC (AmiA/AmiB activator)